MKTRLTDNGFSVLDNTIIYLTIENVKELVSDLGKKAKEIDTLIEGLPGIQTTEGEQVSPKAQNRQGHIGMLTLNQLNLRNI